jgi:acyl carrier protein
MSHEQQVLLEFCAPPAGVIVVYDRVCIRTEGSRRVVLVHGVIVAHYDINDRAAVHLRAHLERNFPHQMIPQLFVFLDRLPRTPRGKIDFASLPAPHFECTCRKPGFVAPRTEVESTLSRIWQEVLAAERISVEDDFLQLGGDSLSAIRIISRINHIFNTDLSLRVIFEAPTIAALAAVLHENLSGD